MSESIDTETQRKHVEQLHKFNHVDNLALAGRAYLDHIDRLQAENQRLKLAALTADRESMELEAENQRLREAVDEVRDLIKESGGVWGLHRNGDDAPWADLLPGGRYETWLLNLGELAGLPEPPVESTGGGDG